MTFSHELTYDASPEQVLDMLADPAFRERVCDSLHVLRKQVTVEGRGAGMRVVVDQTQRADGVPSFARAVVGDEIRILRQESWDGPTRGRLSVSIPGKPGTLDGTVSLAATAGPTAQTAQTVQTVAGRIRVKVPLVGGRLEGLVADLMHAALRVEERVGRDWLRGGH